MGYVRPRGKLHGNLQGRYILLLALLFDLWRAVAVRAKRSVFNGSQLRSRKPSHAVIQV